MRWRSWLQRVQQVVSHLVLLCSTPHKSTTFSKINQSNQIYIAPYVASESEARIGGTRRSVHIHCIRCQTVLSLKFAWKYWEAQQIYSCMTVSSRLMGAETQNTFANNVSEIRGTVSNSLSADRRLRARWYSWMISDVQLRQVKYVSDAQTNSKLLNWN